MASEQPEPPDKRRKIRKGTHSCWECKRRKVRCVYASPTDSVCIGCTRRCTECVSQEFPERRAPPASRSRLVGDRFVRVEAMIESLAKQTGRQPLPPQNQCKEDGTIHGVITPMSCDTPASNTVPSYSPSAEDCSPTSVPEHCFPAAAEYSPVVSKGILNLTSNPNSRPLAEALLAAYPPQEDVDTVTKMTGHLGLYSVTGLFKNYQQIQEDGLGEVEKMRVRPSLNTHPILIAKQMLMLAICMQYINPEIAFEQSGLNELPRLVMKRLRDTADELVMTNNELMGTGAIEGLQCICLEGLYQANTGNLRRAWLSWRRAIAVAQLMGLQRLHPSALKVLDPTFSANPQYVWYRLLYVDRFISLILGLPQASLDSSMASKTILKDETPLGAFERMQCVIASKILERNERDPSADDFARTQEIDLELQQAAVRMPSRWWLTPSFATIANDSQMFWEITRLQNQMSHYNLLNLLHLPYILHSSSGPEEQRKYDYSRITCVNASREVLKGYIVFRSFNRIAYCCRGVDFFALMASLTLLLSHLDGHNAAKHKKENMLAHQRHSDRGMMEQALENMEVVANLNQDVLNAKSANLLRQMLKIEDDAALGSRHKLGRVSGEARDARGVLRIHVPYMGAIIIEREGDSSSPESSSSSVDESLEAPTAELPTRSLAAASLLKASTSTVDTSHLGSISYPGGEPPQPNHHLPGLNVADANQFSANAPSAFEFSEPLEFPSPGLTAGVEQWAFQGVDMAFFNSLMREVDTQTQNETVAWGPMSNTI